MSRTADVVVEGKVEYTKTFLLSPYIYAMFLTLTIRPFQLPTKLLHQDMSSNPPIRVEL